MSVARTGAGAVRLPGTISNLFLNDKTRVIYQGFTGKHVTTLGNSFDLQATLNARDSIAYGTKVVGGVSPGKQGHHPELNLPVYATVKEVGNPCVCSGN